MSSARSSVALRASSADSTALRTSLAVLPTLARSSLGSWPMERRYPVSDPFLPSTPTRTASSACVSAAPSMLASVADFNSISSSTTAMSPLAFVSCGSRGARQTFGPAWRSCEAAQQKSPLSSLLASLAAVRIQGRKRALAVPPWLTKRRHELICLSAPPDKQRPARHRQKKRRQRHAGQPVYERVRPLIALCDGSTRRGLLGVRKLGRRFTAVRLFTEPPRTT